MISALRLSVLSLARLSLAGFVVCFVAPALAVPVTSNVGVSGNLSADVGVTGTVDLMSASGTFRQWILFGHVNVGVTADAQTVGVGLTSDPALDVDGDGTVNLTYDNVTPGTPLELTQGGPPNAIDLDLNGSGGSNTPINFDLGIAPLMIDTSLGSFSLDLTFDGEISDFTLVSDETSVMTGGLYLANSMMTAFLSGDINAVLTGVPIIGNVNLGSIFQLNNAPLAFDFPLPGQATTSDADGGIGPFPNDMVATFGFNASGISVPFPFSQALEVNETASIPNGQSGFSELYVDAVLNAEITLSNVNYLYSGLASQVLVPEPSTVLLLGGGLLALAGGRRRFGA